MQNDTNVRVSKKDAAELRKIAKSQKRTVKAVVSVLIDFFKTHTGTK